MLQIFQIFGGIILILLGVVGVVTPFVPGIILILAGIGMVLNVTIKKIFSWD